MLLPLYLAPAEVGLSYRESDRFPAAEGTGFDFLGPATPLSLGVRPLTRPPWTEGASRFARSSA